jgi:MSHA biogenesis protein MshP
MMHSRGFTLVSAVFLMVVLVVLGVSLVSLSAVQHTTSAQQVQTARAAYAVRAGIEWAIGRTASGGDCPVGPTSFTPGGMLGTFTVSVTCTRSDHDVGSTLLEYYTVDVTATSGTYGSPDYVQRRGQAKVYGE